MIGEREKLLLQLLVSGRDYTREEMETITGDIDFDNERIEFLLMLALLGTRKEFLYIPEKIRPRLEGIYKFRRVKNLMFVPFLESRLKVLDRAGIPVMLLKGAAMNVFYSPGVIREMSDVDLAVPEERVKEAMSLLEASGMTLLPNAAPHSWTFTEGGRYIDLHRWIFKTGGDKAAGDLWERAVPVDVGGVRALVPAAEDMFIHILDSRARDLILDTQKERQLKWLYDSALILKKSGPLDWRHVAERAGELLALSPMTMILPEFAELFPEFITREQCGEYFPQDGEYLHWKKNADRFVKELEDFNAVVERYPEGTINPVKLFLVVRHHWILYRSFYKEDMKKAGIPMSFMKYFLINFRAESLGELFRRYL